ncbi:uncharacterized protein LOC116805258 isoform X2 [Drosophila grimshawi]|uniref:uncharacterized protein LOC116805258 isoform X2 n=1 Tax=Drosophila grimshawi TaxID=7222 RepID=UPI001C936E63|nr:uncharacterized protein LOC116805258 isoform X2 [Drosophila grimshawi]
MMEHQEPASPARQNEGVNRYPTYYSAKKLLKSPVGIRKQLTPSIIESKSKNIREEPRKEEMLKSPLHCANENIASNSKANLGRQSPRNQMDCATGRKFDFNKQNIHKIENRPPPASHSEDIVKVPTCLRSATECRSIEKVKMQKNQLRLPMHPPTITTDEDFDLLDSLVKNSRGEPRRIAELLKSPLHCATSSASKIPSTHASKSKANLVRPSPRNQMDKNIHKLKSVSTSASQSDDVLRYRTFLRSTTGPRSTDELRQSQLQMKYKPVSTVNKNQLRLPMHPPTITPDEDFDLLDSLAKNSRGEPRRIEELLKSPLHCATSSASKIHSHASKSKANLVRPSPRNQMGKIIHKLKSLPASASQSDDVAGVSTSNKNQLRLPMPPPRITTDEDFDLLDSLAKNSRGEPRRIEELLKSPLHCASTKNIRSVPATSKIPSATALVCVPRRKLDFGKKTVRKDGERTLNYLKQIPDFRMILKRGLHTMNVDDFVGITNHLLSLAGSQLKLNKDNYIEQTICAMQLIKYPFKISQSVLRIPSLYFRSVIRIFDFLLEIATAENELVFKDTQSELRDDSFDATPKQELDSVKLKDLC